MSSGGDCVSMKTVTEQFGPDVKHDNTVYKLRVEKTPLSLTFRFDA